jgi:hypothetical protein
MCVLVGGAMALILYLFLKRLKKIENDFWGKASQDAAKQIADARAKVFADAAKPSKKK